MNTHIKIPNEPGQYISAQGYDEVGILLAVNSYPMSCTTVIPMAQALELADLIYAIAKPNAEIEADMLSDALLERKAA